MPQRGINYLTKYREASVVVEGVPRQTRVILDSRGISIAYSDAFPLESARLPLSGFVYALYCPGAECQSGALTGGILAGFAVFMPCPLPIHSAE
ncbi:hypothetical protein RRG08_013159 [Elysia crispata]|uniref:Uncharacterized protein n=1 Tax=Elysia crispata TaxID=231223 RepID=A0AAE1A1G4_9GAST|nr:hypothetical protein RRG08_013159 [Elysia crispata]